MSRGPRLDAPAVLHHVIARGIERRRIFRDDADRTDFLARLAELAVETETPIYAWTLVPNHVHLLLRSNSHRPVAVVARAVVSYLAMQRHGLAPSAVAAYLGVSRFSVVRGFQRAQQLGIESNDALRHLLG